MHPKFTNDLIHETSPYLLQHAHNPVNWNAWNTDVLENAKKENKLLLVSIGYSACHWCHVMEHECFEDESVAEVMNSHFINIKIDREERPDVDQIYMDALQMMTGSGGWPLNIVALPDGRPFWGATYVKKENWKQVLKQLSELYKTEPKKVIGYAENMEAGLKEINLIPKINESSSLDTNEIKALVQKWSQYFDTFLGGYRRAPKFMMPVNLNFLLYFSHSQKDKEGLDYVYTTLNRMAWGGVYDHVGGGFSRYAVDTKWHVPHFEKMLYDNGLLIGLYAKAFALSKNNLYKRVVEETISFLENELLDTNGGFYAALDADSLSKNGKLTEGAYYVWEAHELQTLLKSDFELFSDYYNINSYGYWEEENYVLIRDNNIVEIEKKYQLKKEVIEKRMKQCLLKLKKERDKREKPRLDDKILTSWNGLVLKGITDAYKYIGNPTYLKLALKNADFITEHLFKKGGGLYHHHKNGKSTINGFLEDYANLINAFIGLYEITFDEKWLEKAKELVNYVIQHFRDDESGLFFFTSVEDAILVRRTIEATDNVIPASNSIMALNLLKLSKYFPEMEYSIYVEKMLHSMSTNIKERPENHANWLHLAQLMNESFYEVAIVGNQAKEIAKEIMKEYFPNVILAGTTKDSGLSLLQNRYVENTTQIYICEEGACQLPLTQTKEVLTLLKSIQRH
ncbi:thioredoxin domain-containing protein [Maribacter sp. 2210JD10-5]|uniref:thioredoxin domain-containing protein n=1 Tax=Maribacter sp. 2210JD10-5 TaxID=3386272 RepID=UPI0039BCE9E9